MLKIYHPEQFFNLMFIHCLFKKIAKYPISLVSYINLKEIIKISNKSNTTKKIAFVDIGKQKIFFYK